MSQWTLVVGGNAPLVLAAGQVEQCVLSLQSLGDDVLTVIVQNSLHETAAWSEGDTGKLYQDDTLRFTGRLAEPETAADPSSETKIFRFFGPWWYLRNWPYVGTWAVSVGDPVPFPRDYLFATQNTAQTVAGAVGQVIAEGAYTMQIGTIDAAVKPPIEEIENILCHEAVLKCARFIPDVLGWFDYATTPPTFHFRKSSDIAATSKSITDHCAQILVAPARTMRVPYVEITIKAQALDDTIFFTSFTAAKYPPDGAGWGPLKLAMDARDSWDVSAAGTIAKLIYEAADALAWRGQVSWTAEDPDMSLRPGLVLNLTDGPSAWAEMRSLVQQVQHNILTGTTAVSFGPPGQLGVRELLDLLRPWRFAYRPTEPAVEEQATGESEEQHYGYGQPVDPPGTSSPGSTLPSGTEGEILYHNGTAWVTLAAPAVAGVNAVLRHNGDAPVWEIPEDPCA